MKYYSNFLVILYVVFTLPAGGQNAKSLPELQLNVLGASVALVSGTLHNRGSVWPYWFSRKNGDRDMKKVEKTAGYFNGINFAARIHCLTLVGYGLIDETSRPESVAPAVNTGPKETVILPLSNHMGRDHTGQSVHQALYLSRAEAWKKSALAGQSLPPQSP